jgi:hypothetical protein
MIVCLKESYTVDEGDVKLAVVVGEGQKGYSEVLVDGVLRTSGATILDFNLGRGSELAGRRLRITSAVTDTNPHTNRTTVTYTLAGGLSDKAFQLSYEVDNPGETVDYDAIFRLL